MPSPFIPFDTQYSAHTDVTIHPVTGVATITVAFHPNNRGGYNCKIWELAPPYTGQPVVVRDWVQGQSSVGPFGHGASVALPTGGVLTVVPVAGESSEVRPSTMIDMGLGQAYPLGGIPGPQGPPGPAGAGSVTLFDAPVTSLAWEARTIPANSGVLLDIPATFNVPSAVAYLVRFVVQADAPNVRVRAGSQASPFFLTCNTQVAGVQIHAQGWAPGPICYVSTVNGAAVVWLQVCGLSG